ncbi:MAG: hypothetical protein P8Z79_02475 [Sedimentisphaerales bacterium]
MKPRTITLCALVLLMTSAPLFAQKTEVSVRRGKVVAETQTASVNINAGQKAVLKKDANPLVTVDSPLVQDALELHKLIEKEKEQSDLRVDSSFILVGSADKDEVRGALYFEFPNHGPTATNVLTLGYVSIIENFRVYDLAGNLCKVDVEYLDDTTASYSIHLSKEVQPGGHFKVIGVANLEDIPLIPGGAPAYWKEGPLWYFRTGLTMPYCLNYYRFILPKTTILLDTNREAMATDTVDGRVAVTMKDYTGRYSDGRCMISFLYPERDGTTLADIPDKYLGLRSLWDKRNTETFKREMDRIRAGASYTDQSTPLAALLTCLSSIIHKDIDLYSTVKYAEQPPQNIRGYVEQARYWAGVLDLLSTPEWPDNPGNGYVHPTYLCRKGSMICEFIQPMVYENGKWYVHDTKSRQPKQSSDTTPQDVAAARTQGYLCDWEVAGPYVQKGKKGTELFDIPFGPELPDVNVPWQPILVERHGEHPAYVNLDEALYGFDQAVAYLRTEIASDRQKPARLDIYTDDGVKAWLNGKLIHAVNVSRGILDEPDKVDVTLNEGANDLMLKVTDDVWAWGAIVRVQPAIAVQPVSGK